MANTIMTSEQALAGPTLKELRARSAAALEEHHRCERMIKDKLEEAKAQCPHTKTKLVSHRYADAGRMNGPIFWEEKVCIKCKKGLATRSEHITMSDWTDKK